MLTLLVRAHVVFLQRSKREGKRQMIGDPPPWILIFYGKRVDQEPRWMQRTTYDPPQEQPAKTSWMWQKSLIQQAATKNTVNKSEKKRMTNRICHVSWVILQGNDIRITHVALLCQIGDSCWYRELWKLMPCHLFLQCPAIDSCKCDQTVSAGTLL